ncbi:uncharacterized protein KGF55_003552 [Candida pseudojiufengensis]|uniref:uncharacterized protein n=1 Tax=Candida pseudojiufengensis TaxID=497109 RepID=UPI0022244E75|nr:uncharacterized protein KGF55_003552 [Candida pseudojiufengensis]KAI5962476.1 hypothetical protein KGF55_003552 [Candida pseudojiufengensis]
MSRTNRNWKTLYSYNTGLIYLHLKNNDLLQLQFDLDGQFNKSNNLVNNQQLTTLPPPPLGTSLFLVNDTLYGLTSTNTSLKSNSCEDGSISIIKYLDDSWDNEINLDIDDGFVDSSFYQHSTILTSDNEETIYIYGGVCSSTETITNRLISINLTNGTIANISTSTKPQPFYGASNILAPNLQSQLVIGGESNQGWLNMYQLATWNFDSGWSFKQVHSSTSESTTVNTRAFPLTLPIFKPNSNINNFNIDQILMIGGEMNDKISSPIYSNLQMNTNTWSWNSDIQNNINFDEILGAATIFSTLVVINSTTDLKNKRMTSQGYQINLYDAETFKPVEDVKTNTQIPNKSPTSNSREKIILGTVIPISIVSLILGLLLFYYFYKKRNSHQKEDEIPYNEIDYKFDYLNQQPPSIHDNPIYIHLDNDSSSTLSGAGSMDSWKRKRLDFDNNKKLRNSYLASNETLNIIDDESIENPTTLDPVVIHKSVRNLKKSFSFTNTPPTSPTLQKDTPTQPKLKSLRLTNSEQLLPNSEPNDNESFLSDDDNQNIDAQVLVSSKRRSILKIMNPDMNEDIEDKLRQRIPSNENNRR